MIFLTSGLKGCLNCWNSLTILILCTPLSNLNWFIPIVFLHVLDLTLHLKDGLIVSDIYSKPTDSHLYLPFSSSHPSHCKRAIPYGVALRIKRNCSTDDFLQTRCKEYKGYLKSQNYPANLVDKQFDKALEIPRSELLSKKVKANKKVFPLVLNYNTILPNIQSIIRKHAHLLRSSPLVAEIFPAKSVFPAYRRTKNLKEFLAPSKFQTSPATNQKKTVNEGGCFKCDKNRCDLCKNFLLQASKFHSSATGRHYAIQQKLSCSSKNVIYLATCCFKNPLHLDQLLLTREAYWMTQLFTLNPYGLNKTREFRSKNRINYSN